MNLIKFNVVNMDTEEDNVLVFNLDHVSMLSLGYCDCDENEDHCGPILSVQLNGEDCPSSWSLSDENEVVIRKQIEELVK